MAGRPRVKVKAVALAADGRQLVVQLVGALTEMLDAGAGTGADAEAQIAQSEARAASAEAKFNDAIGECDRAVGERDDAIAERDRAITERDEVIAERDRAISERDEAIAERDSFRREKERIESNFRLVGVAGDAGDTESPLLPARAASVAEVASVAGAVEMADRRFGSLVFMREARESAEESNYQQPAKVFQAFEVLDELARRRVDGTLNRSIGDWLRERGFNYTAHESKTTMGKWGGQRTFRYNGAKVTMAEHIKFGIGPDPANHLRIHLTWDDAGHWLIGHVGRHLTNTKT